MRRIVIIILPLPLSAMQLYQEVAVGYYDDQGFILRNTVNPSWFHSIWGGRNY